MFRTIDDFLETYDAAAGRTIQVLEAFDDAALRQTVADGHRTAAGIAWHIVTTVPEMMGKTGLGLSAVDAHGLPPDSATEIVSGYRKASQELRQAVVDRWTDATLLEADTMYGETWPRGKTLTILIHHEIHHLGQLTVLLRQAGRKVPGIMGPSKEEWAQYGMAEPAY
ncbi:MAG: DinB family protein [Candidatus Eiseniibacteriota bacterium]|jgi:uncharacterized damage-inducible protein DinB